MSLIVLSILSAFFFAIYFFYTIICWGFAKKDRSHRKSSYFPSVTLLICAYNEELMIGKKIEDVAKIDYPKNKLKVLFVNDNSTDKTKSIILNSCAKIPFKNEVIDNGNSRGKINALNYTLPRISSEIIVLSDADCFQDSFAIRELAKNFADQNIGGVSGVIKVQCSNSTNQLTAKHESFYRQFYDLWRKGESVIQSISISNGTIMAFRTSLVQNMKIETLADDTEILFEIIRTGKRFVYDTDAIAYEITPTNISERFNQKIRRAKGIFQVYMKNLDLLGNGRFGKVIFPFVLLQICILPYFFVFGIIIYLWQVVSNPGWLILFIFLIIPKVNTVLFNLIFTQLQLALCPFYFKKTWKTMESSRKIIQGNMN